MRDNEEYLPELREISTVGESRFGVVRLSRNGQSKDYQIGLLENEYKVWKRIQGMRLFDPLDAQPYQYFFVPSVCRTENGIETQIKVKQGRDSKDIRTMMPERMISNLMWFAQLKDLEEAKHLLKKQPEPDGSGQ